MRILNELSQNIGGVRVQANVQCIGSAGRELEFQKKKEVWNFGIYKDLIWIYWRNMFGELHKHQIVCWLEY